MARFTSKWDPRYGMYVRKRTGRSRRRRGFGELGAFGQAQSLKASFDSIKDVLFFGALAAGGAIGTDYVWNTIGGKMNLKPTETSLAKMATGVALGMIVTKFTKKPKIGAAIAVGACVMGFVELVGRFLTPTVEGLGILDVARAGMYPALRESPVMGSIPAVTSPGLTASDVPAWMVTPSTPNYTYAV